MRYSSDDRISRIVGHLEYNFVQAIQSSYHAVQCLFIGYPRGPASGRDVISDTILSSAFTTTPSSIKTPS